MSAPFRFPDFKVHPTIRQAHLQTIYAILFPRRFRAEAAWRAAGEAREFVMPDGDRLTGVLHRHPADPDRKRPLLLLISGLEGDVDADYMQGMSSKAFAAGYHSLRLNYRTCGGTEHLSRRFYNGGLIEDVDRVIRQLAKEGPWPIVVAGVSLGANLLLRLLGTYGEQPPAGLFGAVSISPPIDLTRVNVALGQGFNRVYGAYFMRSMKRKLRRRLELADNTPEETACYRQAMTARSLREVDDLLTAPLWGYADAMDFYRRASTGDLIEAIRVPTLLIHAQDDPLIDMSPFEQREASWANHPALTTLYAAGGGHVGFLQAKGVTQPEPWMDAYWAENAAIAYVRWLETAISARALDRTGA